MYTDEQRVSAAIFARLNGHISSIVCGQRTGDCQSASVILDHTAYLVSGVYRSKTNFVITDIVAKLYETGE
jgi:hypothetical protein